MVNYYAIFVYRWSDLLLCRLIDIVSLFVEIAVPYLVTEIQNSQKRLFESSMNGPASDVPIQDIFALYRRTKVMLDIYQAFCPQ